MATEPVRGARWVLLPGTLCTGAVFDPFLDELGVPVSARHVVTLNAPGVEDYLPELTSLTDPQTIICAFSLGAIVAAHLVDRLAAAECMLFGLNAQPDDPGKQQGRFDLAVDVARMGGAAALAGRLGPLVGPDPDRARTRILAMAEEAGPHIGAQTRLALDRPGALPALSRAAMPVTCLTGRGDQQAPLARAQEAARAAPQGRVLPLAGLGHYALVEDPDACAQAVAEGWR